MVAQVSNKVFLYRTKSGSTQEDVAQSTGVSRQTIIAIEKGNYTPSVLLAIKIAQHFNVSVEDIFTITHNR